jgi:uncharacterized surface protein with fasciclin (FAS1) repeats
MSLSTMKFLHIHVFVMIIVSCTAGPMEEIANMPDLTLVCTNTHVVVQCVSRCRSIYCSFLFSSLKFYQQLMRQQDLHMLLQGIYSQQQAIGMNDWTIFAPNNEAMARLRGKNEDLNLLWKYHIVPGRYDEQTLYTMSQEKLSQVNPRQMLDTRAQNILPTIASPFQVKKSRKKKKERKKEEIIRMQYDT